MIKAAKSETENKTVSFVPVTSMPEPSSHINAYNTIYSQIRTRHYQLINDDKDSELK